MTDPEALTDLVTALHIRLDAQGDRLDALSQRLDTLTQRLDAAEHARSQDHPSAPIVALRPVR